MGPILIHTTLLKEWCEQREKQVHGTEAGRCPEHKREQRSLSVQLQQGLKQKGTLSPSRLGKQNWIEEYTICLEFLLLFYLFFLSWCVHLEDRGRHLEVSSLLLYISQESNLGRQAWQPCLGLWEGHIFCNVQQSLRGGRVEGRDWVRTQWQWCKTEAGEGNSPCVTGKAEEYLYSIFGMHSEGGTN